MSAASESALGRRWCHRHGRPRATGAGHDVLARGGNAVDAAIAANAVLSVTAPHLCGMGGDLFALVHTGAAVLALNASGRAPSGADAAVLRREGLTAMPFRHDVRSVTVPGCVDGWVTMHAALGRLPLGDVLAAAIELADDGAAAAPSLVAAVRTLDPRGRSELHELSEQAVAPGAAVRRAGARVGAAGDRRRGPRRVLRRRLRRGIARHRSRLVHRGRPRQSTAEWVEPLARDVWGHRVHTLPPNSQGYVTLATAAIAEANGLTDDPQRSVVGARPDRVGAARRPRPARRPP